MFDITLHPISEDELVFYLIDPFNDENLVESRIHNLLKQSNPKQEAFIRSIYQNFSSWKNDSSFEPSKTLAFSIAAIAGYLHPYFYSASLAISFLADIDNELKKAFSSLSEFGLNLKIESAPLIESNFSASGFIDSKHFPLIRKKVANLKTQSDNPRILALLDDYSFSALNEALDFAEKQDLGLIEAADLVEPYKRRGSTNLENLRAKPFAAHHQKAKAIPEHLCKHITHGSTKD